MDAALNYLIYVRMFGILVTKKEIMEKKTEGRRGKSTSLTMHHSCHLTHIPIWNVMRYTVVTKRKKELYQITSEPVRFFRLEIYIVRPL